MTVIQIYGKSGQVDEIFLSHEEQSCQSTKCISSMSFHARYTSETSFVRLATKAELVHSSFANTHLTCLYLATHSAVPSNISSVYTFVSLAIESAQYTPLMSASLPWCMLNEFSAFFREIKNPCSFSLKMFYEYHSSTLIFNYLPVDQTQGFLGSNGAQGIHSCIRWCKMGTLTCTSSKSSRRRLTPSILIN
jgi:hypothetical protein